MPSRLNGSDVFDARANAGLGRPADFQLGAFRRAIYVSAPAAVPLNGKTSQITRIREVLVNQSEFDQCGWWDLNPHGRLSPLASETSLSANFNTSACRAVAVAAGDGIRIRDSTQRGKSPVM